ncbi:MAG: FadD3 family acyl-CoA ligase [Spongiibacteraceae bacterium]|jgi:acyl-CoA synthetase (AMP-forming)/AMP-acid ligase II|nr:FadD3 family acyl-CoA ligase [Spongiibacteraceae bacterium]
MANVPVPLTLPLLVQHAAKRDPERVAIRDGEIVIRYRELEQIRRRVARAVMAAGIAKGDRVAIWAPNIAEWITAAIGLQSAGAILVPLNNRWQGSEAADVLRRSGVRLLFTYPQLEKGSPLAMLAGEDLPALERRVLLRGEDAAAQSWSDFLAAAETVSEADAAAREAGIKPTDAVDMLFTSGTTGRPKGVLSSHEQNIRAFSAWSDTVDLRADDNYMIINPFFHSFGYKAGWLAALIKGCTILPVISFDKEKVFAQIERDRVTMLPGAPSLYEMLLADPLRERYDLSSLRLGVTGAASVPVQLVRDMRDILGFQTVVTAYGLTESTGVVTVCRPDDDPEVVANTSGRAIPGVELQCVDPATGAVVAPGQEGEIWVRGYNVMQGYFEDPVATAEAITEDGWLRTGDIGVIDERGYLTITDRLKDMYIMNGENVYPAEIEKTLYELAGVAQAAVIGVPRQPQGEVGMAFIVTRPGSNLDEAAVKAHCAARLARYKQPFFIRFVDGLPMNAAGKVVKPELRKLAQDLLP